MDIRQQLEQIASEREIPVDELMQEVERSLAAAYKKHVGATGEVTVHISDSKAFSVMLDKEVVGVVTDVNTQISLEEAKKKRPSVNIGDFVESSVDPNRFGRIAAATFKQLLSQKLREVENRQVNEVFHDKLHDIVTGTVSRRDPDSENVYVQVNRVEAEMGKREQVPTERYRPNDRLKVYVLRVDDTAGRLRIFVSRTHKNLLRKLFELEVPEIKDGIVEIKNVAREPGQRSKLAVVSHDERVDALGACVGPRGSRVQSIVEELHGEKIDIVLWSEDAKKFIENALNPAKVISIKLSPEENPMEGRSKGKAFCIVPNNQLSLAIGKGGQNVRLATRLTEWAIDIRSESDAATDGKR